MLERRGKALFFFFFFSVVFCFLRFLMIRLFKFHFSSPKYDDDDNCSMQVNSGSAGVPATAISMRTFWQVYTRDVISYVHDSVWV